jgi:hypothetical protein
MVSSDYNETTKSCLEEALCAANIMTEDTVREK